MDWLERYKRLQNKHRRAVIRRNVQAYRRRQKQAGIQRIDVALSEKQHAVLLELMLPGESTSQAVGRLLESVTGNTKPV